MKHPCIILMSGNTTIEKKGTKTISVQTTGAEKRHLTVVLAATADGQMLPLNDFSGEAKPKEHYCSQVRLARFTAFLYLHAYIIFVIPIYTDWIVFKKKARWMVT